MLIDYRDGREATMTSAAKRASAIQNAQKSTGPKTEGGKRKSRMNALKHGLTAKTVLLPDEDPDEFRLRMVGWFESVKPRDPCEAGLLEQAVYSLWQVDRAHRSDAARLWLKADSYREDKESQEEDEADGLVRRLLAPPHGRPTALPCHSGHDHEPAGDSKSAGTVSAGDHPSDVISRLLKTGSGCWWLLELWSDLRASLEKDGWRAPERFRAFRLLGIHASDVYMTIELGSILQACQALDPDAGSLVSEVWNEFVPAAALPVLEATYQREIAHKLAPDQDQARHYLLEIINRETTFIEEKAQRYEERAKAEEELARHKLAFDDGREGRLMRRYADSSKKFFFRCLDELYKHRAEKAAQSNQETGTRYILPWPAWFEAISQAGESSESQIPNSKGPEEATDGGECTKSQILNSKSQILNSNGTVEAADGGEKANSQIRNPEDGKEGEEPVSTESQRSEIVERVEAEGAELAPVERVGEEGGTRVVTEGPRREMGSGIHVAGGSKKERRKRRREERLRRVESSLVPGPLLVG
jgi:hypothetical protein